MAENNILEAGSLRKMLDLLADGQFHSGEELGLLLGVSRAAVWKHLQKLEGIGIKLLSVKGRGYCIDGGLDLLNLEKIVEQIQSPLPLKFNLFPQVDSTNAYLMRHKNPALQVCLAESQSAGRGRRGRVWVSPFAQNIYCSIGWGFEGGVAALEHDGQIVNGVGADTDIVTASAKAYLHALNLLSMYATKAHPQHDGI